MDKPLGREGNKAALVPRSDFLGLEEATYLYSGAEGPMLAAGAAALQEYARHKSGVEAGRARLRPGASCNQCAGGDA